MKNLIFFFSLFIFISISQSAHAATITVCPSSCDNSTIQDAVDAASTGDIILVGDGTYNENLIISKPVDLRSVNGSGVTIINASDPMDNAIYIDVDNVNISGFIIQGANDDTLIWPAGIYLDGASNSNISNNKITDNYDGIFIDNWIADANYNLITGNNISANSDMGIYLFGGSFNLIYNNYFANNAWGNAEDFDTTNNWNTTYQPGTNILGGAFIGGNFWDDYTGQDNGNGSFPNNISFDGIGDTDLPYAVDYGFSGVGDYLPLVIPDLTPPTISNIENVTITDISAIIVWQTDEVSNSQVKYNTSSGSYNYTESDGTFTKFHRIVLTNLIPKTTYYFVVNSTDRSGNSNQSTEYSFKTGDFYTVCESSGCNFTTIQGAINNLSSGNRIFVFNGTYNEKIVLNKSLTLQGQDSDTTSINCGEGICISVEAVGGNIMEFSIQNGTQGISVNNSNYTIISKNIVQNNRYIGIYLENSHFSRLIDNEAINNQLYYGVGVKTSDGVYIENNNASSNTIGIFISLSCETTIKDSTTNDNSYYGIYLGSLLSCSFSSYSNLINNITSSRNYFGLFGTLINSVNISYSNFINNAYKGIYLYNASNIMIQGGTSTGPDTSFSATPSGARVIVDKTWQSGENNVSYTVNIDNFGLNPDTFTINVTNFEGAFYDMDEGDVTLIPGGTAARTLTVGNGSVGDFRVVVESISQNDGTVRDSVEATTILTGSSNNSIIQGSIIPGSTIIDSAVYDSNITNSNVTRSIIRSSNVSGTSLTDIILENAVVSSGVISSGNITIKGIKYVITTPVAVSSLILGFDVEDSTLIGVNGTRLNVSAETSNLSFEISAARDYIGAEMRVQRSLIQPADAETQTNNLGGYSYVIPSRNVEGSIEWVFIIVYYNQSEVDAKNINESTLRLEFYNESSQAWEEITPGGVNTTGDYVFANSTHFSVLGLRGDIRPTPSPVTTTSVTVSFVPVVIPDKGVTTLNPMDLDKLIRQFEYRANQFFITSPELAGVLAATDIFATYEGMVSLISKVAWRSVSVLKGDVYSIASQYALLKFPQGSEEVIISRGDLGLDSCAAVAYARMRRVPILLVKPGELPDVTKDALEKLGTKRVIILGGLEAVSSSVEESLPSPTRIGGRDRYQTAVKIAESLMSAGEVDTVIVTDGENMDMTSVMIASYYNAPIVYTQGDELTPETRALLELGRFNRIILLGVPPRAEERIRSLRQAL